MKRTIVLTTLLVLSSLAFVPGANASPCDDDPLVSEAVCRAGALLDPIGEGVLEGACNGADVCLPPCEWIDLYVEMAVVVCS